jgi:hypothetical protein
MTRESLTDAGPSGEQFMRGLAMVGVLLALTYGATPFVTALPRMTQQWSMVAVLIAISYGLFTAVTSPLVLSLVDDLRESDRIPLE